VVTGEGPSHCDVTKSRAICTEEGIAIEAMQGPAGAFFGEVEEDGLARISG